MGPLALCSRLLIVRAQVPYLLLYRVVRPLPDKVGGLRCLLVAFISDGALEPYIRIYPHKCEQLTR